MSENTYQLPALPDGYFWRISPVYTSEHRNHHWVELELRKKGWLFSSRVTYCTVGVNEHSDTKRKLSLKAEELEACFVAARQASNLAGDYPPKRLEASAPLREGKELSNVKRYGSNGLPPRPNPPPPPPPPKKYY